jgi:Cys-tRNA(Pro)/Cys-tRNA(Cys) deacylase
VDNSTPGTQTLERLGIPYRVFRHAQPPVSLERAAAERGQQPEQVVRSILFRLAEDDFVLVLVAGPGQLSWRKLRAHLGVSRLSMASEEDVLRVTGSPIGAVGPLGLTRPMRILADRSVFQPDEISIGSGIRGTAIVLRAVNLKKALGDVEIGEFI